MSTFFVASVCLLIAVITAQPFPYGDQNAQGQQAGAYGGLENGEAVGIPNNNQFVPQAPQAQLPQSNINSGAASGEFGRVNSAENQQNAGPYGGNQNRPAAQGYGPQTNVYGAPSGASGYGQQQQFGYGQQAAQVPAGPYGRF
uniref:Uncharacterized protein n=1 Tax=Panagrellus redivivus TaxID=6233 RepID=A0A7E4ZQB2_PANRE